MSIERVSNAESNYDKFQPDDGQFIQKDIGERYRNTKNDGGLFRGGIALQGERTIEDAQRIGKFLGTGKGRIFTLKQLFELPFEGTFYSDNWERMGGYNSGKQAHSKLGGTNVIAGIWISCSLPS